MEDISIRENVAKFYNDVEMPGGYFFNHVKTLKRIELYYNSQFESGPYDSKGYRKFFFNVVKPPCDVARKFVDLDTKDIILQSELPEQEWKVWLMQHDLHYWLKNGEVGELLNDIGEQYPEYGHVFIKKTKEGWKTVNIHNLRFDPSSEDLDCDVFFYELHRMTGREISEMNWNQKEEIQALLEKKQNEYLVYECYDYNISGKKWSRSFRANLWEIKKGNNILTSTESQFNSDQEYLPSFILHKDQINELPYRELQWEKVPGRRLGKGFVEALFDNQIAENEAEYLERKGLYFKALQLWQTRDQTIGSNVLTEAESGDILSVSSEVTPIQKDQSDLAAFNQTRTRWGQNSDRITFSYDIARGDNLPSRTPLGVANLSVQQVISYFEKKRENFGLFIKELILDDVLPDFKTDKYKRHQMVLLSSASGVDKFIEAVAHELVDQDAWDYAMGKGKGYFPDKTEYDNEVQAKIADLKKQKLLGVDIPDAFYEDAKFTMDVVTTGEQIDVSQQSQAMMLVLQMVNTNPAVLQNPTTRAIIFKMLELAGMNPIDLGMLQDVPNDANAMPMQPGGSVAMVPQGIANPSLTPKKQIL